MKVVIIGLGSIGKRHVKILKHIDKSIEVYALRSNLDKSNFPGVTNIKSFDDIIFKPDFIIISNPTYLHEQTINMCIKIGVSIFIEKPVLSKIKNANSIIKLLKKFEIKTYVGCNMRFHPCIKYLKENLLLNSPNEVNIYHGTYLPKWREGNFREQYSSDSNKGGGVHLDLIHELDYCTWLFGFPEKVTNTYRSNSTLKIDSIDFANHQLFYKSFNAGIILNYFRNDIKRQFEILYEDHTIHVDLLKNTIKSNEKIIYTKKTEINQLYIDQMNFFLKNLNKPGDFENNFSYGVKILKLIVDE